MCQRCTAVVGQRCVKYRFNWDYATVAVAHDVAVGAVANAGREVPTNQVVRRTARNNSGRISADVGFLIAGSGKVACDNRIVKRDRVATCREQSSAKINRFSTILISSVSCKSRVSDRNRCRAPSYDPTAGILCDIATEGAV